VYVPGVDIHGTVTEVRYRDCVIQADDKPPETITIFDCRFLLPEEECEDYKKKVASVLSPTPENPFDK